jgi:AcrR family transcriptional regulator
MSEAAERETQAERRSRSEEALLAAAAELVAERGVQGASLARIGGRAGVSRGLPTHHFGSKDALVSQLAERAQHKFGLAITEAERRHAAQHGEPSAFDRILISVDACLALFDEPGPDERALLVMWGSTFPSAASVEGMVDAERRSYEGLSQMIVAGQEDGSVRADVDPIVSAVLLHGLMRGVSALYLTDRRPADMDLVRRTCHQWIAAALAPSQPEEAPR